jgi:PAS domain S-box-containing protein
MEELTSHIAKLEEELQKVKSNFNRALEQGKAVVYSRNFDSLVYDFMGDGIKNITGYSSEEMTPAMFDSITINAEPTGELANISLEEAYRRNRAGMSSKWIADTQIRTKSGEIKYVLDMSTNLRDGTGHFYGCLGILFDITERKHMEQELAKTTEELRQRNDEIEQDLETARDIQHALLAHTYKHFPLNVPPEESMVRFHDFYIPAQKLSGDFFYIMPVSENIVGVLIGDVMGHGVRASLITAFLRGLIEEIKPFAHENDIFLQKLNYGLLSVLSHSRASSFVTAVYVTVDVENKVLRYANAGHPEPLFTNRTTGPIELPFLQKRRTEPALGLLSDFPYTVSARKIAHEDVVYLYTDGVSDVWNEKEELFGKNRLISFVNSRCTASRPEVILKDLLREIRCFAGSKKEFSDDLCMVALHMLTPS